MSATRQEGQTGRVAQRSRTHQRLIEAAAGLSRAGHPVTLEDAAAAAGMSRATAFRYFTTDSLQLEVSLTETLQSVDGPVAEIQRLCTEITDHCDRVEAVVRCMARWSWHAQESLRVTLRHSLVGSYRRPGHRQKWIELALAPALPDLQPERAQKLRRALTLLFGLEPLLSLNDLLHLERDEALDTLAFTARALVTAALNAPACDGVAAREEMRRTLGTP